MCSGCRRSSRATASSNRITRARRAVPGARRPLARSAPPSASPRGRRPPAPCPGIAGFASFFSARLALGPRRRQALARAAPAPRSRSIRSPTGRRTVSPWTTSRAEPGGIRRSARARCARRPRAAEDLLLEAGEALGSPSLLSDEPDLDPGLRRDPVLAPEPTHRWSRAPRRTARRPRPRRRAPRGRANSSGSGHGARMIVSPIAKRCQISSVTNGITGCSSRSVRSRIHARTLAVSVRTASSSDRSRSFSISRPQSQNSDQKNRYMRLRGRRELEPVERRRSPRPRSVGCRDRSQRCGAVSRSSGGSCGSPPGNSCRTSRAAFQILFAKFRPPWIESTDSGMSCWPPVASRASENRSASAPWRSIISIGVDHVAERLRHLPTVAVADEPVDHDVAERDVAGERHAGHDHPRDPEVEDLVAGHQDGVRIEGAELRVSRRASRASRTARAAKRTTCPGRPGPARAPPNRRWRTPPDPRGPP